MRRNPWTVKSATTFPQLQKLETNTMKKFTYDWDEDRFGNVLIERTGNCRYRNLYIQGDDAQALVAELEPCKNQKQIAMVLSEYFECVDEDERSEA